LVAKSVKRKGSSQTASWFFVAVLAEKGNDTNQSFWLAQVLEVHGRQDDGSRDLSAVWFESKKEFGLYRRCKGVHGKEMTLSLSQCLFWFEKLSTRGDIPKQFHSSIKAALEYGVDSDVEDHKHDAGNEMEDSDAGEIQEWPEHQENELDADDDGDDDDDEAAAAREPRSKKNKGRKKISA
jgi:hypothetical protein